MSYSSYEDKRNIELDDMNIKAHLNASLELSQISVSEDLIARTLAAIKEQAADKAGSDDRTSEKQDHNKLIAHSRYIRGLATACAAVLLIVVGYTAMKQFPLGMKGASSAADQEINLTTEATVSDNMSATASSEAPRKAATEDALLEDNDISAAKDATNDTFDVQNEEAADTTMDTAAEDQTMYSTAANTDDASDIGSFNDATALEKNDMSIKSEGDYSGEMNSSSMLQSPEVQVYYTFRNILIPSPEQAEYIVITDNLSNTSVKLTTQEDIRAFYEIMDDHEFAAFGGDPTGSQDFTVEMKNTDTQMRYRMLVGRYLTVTYTQGDTVFEKYYYAVDEELFQGDIETLYLEFSE
jgi:hypothetical protein